MLNQDQIKALRSIAREMLTNNRVQIELDTNDNDIKGNQFWLTLLKDADNHDVWWDVGIAQVRVYHNLFFKELYVIQVQ